MMGQQFCGPVLTPYGIFLGLTRKEVASLYTATAAGQVISSLLLASFSDRKGRKLAVIVSATGSFVAYFMQGAAASWDYPSSYWVLLAAKAASGLFAGTFAVVTAFLTEISNGNYELLMRRMTIMVMVQQQGGNFFGPVAGSISTFGLYIPFFLTSAVALIAIPLLVVFFQNPAVVNAQEARAKLQQDGQDPDKSDSSPKVGSKSPPPKAKGDQNPFLMDPVM